MGPVASQIAIKQLGTNGGGFFNVNSAYPFENSTPLANFLETLAILLIPSALCYTFGVMVQDKRQGWAILAAMIIIFIPFFYCLPFLLNKKAILLLLNWVLIKYHKFQSFFQAAIWKAKKRVLALPIPLFGQPQPLQLPMVQLMLCMILLHRLGGLIPLWLMHLGEVVFGGVGSGLYGMLMVVIITVFVAGLMVGRTPEYLGKKIEPYEMKMASIGVLIMPLIVLFFTAMGISITKMGVQVLLVIQARMVLLKSFMLILPWAIIMAVLLLALMQIRRFIILLGGIAMLIGRYWIAIPALGDCRIISKKNNSTQCRHIAYAYAAFHYFVIDRCHNCFRRAYIFSCSCLRSYR